MVGGSRVEVVAVAEPRGHGGATRRADLAWEDAPHLIVAGANEGHLPESIHGDRFLPEKLRERLDLRTNGDRFARDAWLLELLLRTRANEGRVDILVGRQCANGNPLKPSRLLFRCSGRELPQRVECLFGKLASGPQPPSWKPAWKLKPGLIQPVEKLSASSIASGFSFARRFRRYGKHFGVSWMIWPRIFQLRPA